MTESRPTDDPFLLSLDGPFLGLDVGDVRIGVAASDPTALIARPLDTVQRIPKTECLNRMETLLRETGAAGLVVGLPLLENGEPGEQAEKTRAFLRSLARRLPKIRVAWWDERFSTGDARNLLDGKGETHGGPPGRGHGASRGLGEDASRRSRRDEIAATLLLQEWLDARRRTTAAPRP